MEDEQIEMLYPAITISLTRLDFRNVYDEILRGRRQQ